MLETIAAVLVFIALASACAAVVHHARKTPLYRPGAPGGGGPGSGGGPAARASGGSRIGRATRHMWRVVTSEPVQGERTEDRPDRPIFGLIESIFPFLREPKTPDTEPEPATTDAPRGRDREPAPADAPATKPEPEPEAEPVDAVETQTTADDPADPEPDDTPPGPHQADGNDTEESPMFEYLYEAGATLANQKFRGVLAFEMFAIALAEGTEATSRTWVDWAEFMDETLKLDKSVWEPIQACGAHQAMVSQHLRNVSNHVTGILNGSTNDALEKGVRVPHHELLDEDDPAAPAVPEFYEAFSQAIYTKHEDLRGDLMLLHAIKEASETEAETFRALATRLDDDDDLRMKDVADEYRQAAYTQGFITHEIEEAAIRFEIVLTMTLREMATSGVRGHNANRVNAA